VDSEAVLEKIKNPKTNDHLKILLVFYLPLTAWDDDIFEMVSEKKNSGQLEKLFELISKRAPQDLDSPELFTKFAEFVYEFEITASRSTNNLLNFDFTILMIKSKTDLISSNSKLAFCAEYLEASKNDQAYDFSNVSEEQHDFLLTLIYSKHRGSSGLDPLNLSREELRYVIDLMNNFNSGYAAEFISEMIQDYKGTIITDLAQSALDGEAESLELIKTIILKFFCYPINEKRAGFHQSYLFDSLYSYGQVDLFLNLIRSPSISNKDVKLLFANLTKAVKETFKFEIRDNGKGETKFESDLVIENLNKAAQDRFGKLFLLFRNVRKMWT
jgi:hypothetical protein